MVFFVYCKLYKIGLLYQNTCFYWKICFNDKGTMRFFSIMKNVVLFIIIILIVHKLKEKNPQIVFFSCSYTI